MEYEELIGRLQRAFDNLISNDSFLISNNLSERSIAHKLGCYLQNEFPEYNVDCEYNGYVESHRNRKYINILRSIAEELGILKGTDERDLINRKIYPDIIVHLRGVNPDSNLLIVETKKSTSIESFDFDFEKLKRFTSNEYENNLCYSFGLFIEFVVDENPQLNIKWFRNGEEFEF